MNALRLLSILPILLWLTGSVAWSAGSSDSPGKCVGCQSAINRAFYWVTTPLFAERQPLCETCHKITIRCAICKLPIPAGSHKLPDGRVLCNRDFAAGIFSEREALRIYEEARRDVHGFLQGFGVLPDRNISVSLVDGRQLTSLNQSLPSVHDNMSLLGLTRTTVTSVGSRKQYQHTISLLSGLSPAGLAAVCAHEYTHTWLNENIPADRRLEKDTIEGFCELVAYKLMVRRNEEPQKRLILANAYTRGQINAFVQAENSMQFHRVVQWIMTGVDESMAESNGGRALAVHSDPTPLFVWPPPAATPTTVPGTLMLKGISGTSARRFALINDATLTKDEETRVRVGSSSLIVRCLEIRPQSVVIQIKGWAAPTELFLGAAN